MQHRLTPADEGMIAAICDDCRRDELSDSATIDEIEKRMPEKLARDAVAYAQAQSWVR
jgi:hypothetical protein